MEANYVIYVWILFYKFHLKPFPILEEFSAILSQTYTYRGFHVNCMLFDVTTSYLTVDRQENVTSHAYRTVPEMTSVVVSTWRQHIQLLWKCNMAAFTIAEVDTYGRYTNAIWIPNPLMWKRKRTLDKV